MEPIRDPHSPQRPSAAPPGEPSDPISTPTRGGSDPREQNQLRPLDPRVKPRWWLGGAVALLQVLVPVVILDVVVPHPLGSWRPTLAVLAVGVLMVAVLPPIRYRRWGYALRGEDLWIRSGLLTVTVSVIPYRRLQFVDTRSSPLDRLFGLAELIVHTAALGTSGRLPGLDATEAERLREVLSHIAPDDDTL